MRGARNTIQTGMAHQHLPPGAGFAAARVCNEGRARADHWRDRSSVGMGWSLSGGGWVWFFQAQPLQSQSYRRVGVLAVSVCNTLKAGKSAVFARGRAIATRSDPAGHCNGPRIVIQPVFLSSAHSVGRCLSFPEARTSA